VTVETSRDAKRDSRRSPGATTRNAAIDCLRVFLTALVILHHTAIEYGGSGGWYWREQPDSSNLGLVMLNAIDQSFFMGFFFLLAGYYTPSAYAKKGPAGFLAERGLRLGVPLLGYFFLVQPLTVALARSDRGGSLLLDWWHLFLARDFAPGPLWFAEALLFFAMGFVLWRKIYPLRAPLTSLPHVSTLALIATGLGLLSFSVRFVYPAGKELLWLQLGYFPCYIFLFAAGCAAASSHLLERLTFSQVRPWLVISGGGLLTLPAVLFLHLGSGAFSGGWTSHAFYYALWDPFVATGIILGLLWFAQVIVTKPTLLGTWLARRAYGAYIVHPPVVVGLSVPLKTVAISPILKFGVVGLAASLASFLIASLLLRIPGASRIL
jgi:hypothetical protein